MSKISALAMSAGLIAISILAPDAASACEEVVTCSRDTDFPVKWIVLGVLVLAYFSFEAVRWWWFRLPDVSVIATDDPRLVRAKQKALLSIDEFWRHFNDPAPDEDEFALKIAQETKVGPETIWVGEISERNGQLFGRLLNESISPEYEFAQTVRFDRDQICDWTFCRSGEMIGNFTVAVMIDQLSNRSRRQVLKQYGWNENDLARRMT